MSHKASPLLKPEVAKDGVVRIPSTSLEDRPWAKTAAASTKAPSGQITAIKRLDGTIDTNLGSKIMPTNPNFAPRKAWPGGMPARVAMASSDARGWRYRSSWRSHPSLCILSA